MSVASQFAEVVGLGPPSVSARLSEFDLQKMGIWQGDHFTEEGEAWALKAFTTAIGERKWDGRTNNDRTKAQLIEDIKRRVLEKDKACTARHSRWTACPHETQIKEEVSKGLYEDEADLERIQVVGNGLIRHHWHEAGTQTVSVPSQASTRVATVSVKQDPHPYPVKLAAAGVSLGAKLGGALARGYSELDDMSKRLGGSSRKDW
jgi:hypothetical protein